MRYEILAVVGSRNHPDLDYVREMITQTAAKYPALYGMVSGGAAGVDTVAKQYALDSAWEYLEYRATHPLVPAYLSPRDALIYRNTLIAATCDIMLAFTKETRGGTLDAIAQAKRFRRKLITIED